MSLPWSDQQREWLRALGHEVLLLAASPAHEPDLSAPVSARGASPLVAHPVPAQGMAGLAAAVPDTALLHALARAAGRQPQDAGFLGVLPPDLSALRGSPAARRALWPRLRALRKRG